MVQLVTRTVTKDKGRSQVDGRSFRGRYLTSKRFLQVSPSFKRSRAILVVFPLSSHLDVAPGRTPLTVSEDDEADAYNSPDSLLTAQSRDNVAASSFYPELHKNWRWR